VHGQGDLVPLGEKVFAMPWPMRPEAPMNPIVAMPVSLSVAVRRPILACDAGVDRFGPFHVS
jgi:hypothetical protein